jgi:hypothetical protein
VGGAAPLALALGVYHTLAFGNPFATAYHYPGTPAIQAAVSSGWLGYQLPTPHTLWALTGGLETGLLIYCPAVAAGLAGAVLVVRGQTGPRRATAVACLALTAAYLLLNASRVDDYHAGHGHGPRYMLVALPFALWFLPDGLARLPRRASLGLATACYLIALLGVLSGTHYWPQGASLLQRASDVAHAGPRLPWLFVLARSTGWVGEGLVPLLSGTLLVVFGGGVAGGLWKRDRTLAALGLGLGVSALVLLI